MQENNAKNTTPKKIVLIDGMSVIYRSYYGLQQTNLSNRKNEPTGAIYGFINTLFTILNAYPTQYMIAAFDCHEPTFRHKIFPDYKANRQKTPDDLLPQIDAIKTFLDLVGIKRIELPGFEADDIIGTLAKKLASENTKVFCVTGDKDLFQLIDNNINIVRHKHTNSGYDTIDEEGVQKKLSISSKQVIDYLALSGDSSDNVPGVKGIGEKTAKSLLQEFNSIDNIYNYIESNPEASKLKPSVKQKLINDKESAILSKQLVTINTNVELDINNIDDIKISEGNYLELFLFFKKYSLASLQYKWIPEDILIDIRNNKQNILEEKDESVKININYEFADLDNIQTIIDNLLKSELIAIEIETDTNNRNTCNITGVAITDANQKVYYFDIKNNTINNNNSNNKPVNNLSLFDEIDDESDTENNNSFLKKDIPLMLEKLKALFESKNVKKCGYDLKNTAFLLKRYNIELQNIDFDIMLAEYILESERETALSFISQRYLNYVPKYIDKVKKAKPQEISHNDIIAASAESVLIYYNLYEILKNELNKNDLNYIFNEIEMPLIKVLMDMEITGIRIDTNLFLELNIKTSQLIAEIKKEIYNYAGEEFNIDSPKQLSSILFDKLQLPTYNNKKNKTGSYSTAFEVLQELEHEFPIVKEIITYKKLVKLQTTYIETLPIFAKEANDDKIHTTYKQAAASTGRLTSIEPNLQNIPIRTDLGRELRKGFIPKYDYLLSADYSQIELRVMAYLCNDNHLIEAFKLGQDVHKTTAAKIFDQPIENITPEMRSTAKTVNFGIMYGMEAFGLSQRLGISRNNAAELITNYFERFPNIKNYIDNTIEFVQKNGYAKTITGRRRYFTDINNKNRNIRMAAERAAVNMPVQGTASDMIKIAMINVYKEFIKNNLKSKMILQIHDELVFDIAADELEIVKNIVYQQMTNSFSLGEVPIDVHISYGKTWFEAHD